MPKSSIDRPTPISCSRFAVRATCASISVVSVSSSTSAFGLIPAWAMAARTSSGKLGRCICWAATFTDTVKPEPVSCASFHTPHLAARLSQHPVADRHEQPGVFGDSEEVFGHQQTSGGVPPAQERFDAVDRAGAHLDDRLVVEAELVAFDRAVQLGFDAEACERAGVQELVEELEAVAPAALGVVHGGAGTAEELVATRRAVTERDPDAHGDGQRFAGDVTERCAERVDDAVGERAGDLVAGEPFAEHDELVATETRHGGARRDELADPGGDGHEQVVARRVAEPVVDDVEPVEVEQQQADARGPRARTGQRAVEAVGEQRPVGEPGEGVAERVPGELLLVQLAVGDVDVVHDGAAGLRPQGRHLHDEPVLLVGAVDGIVEGEGLFRTREHGAEPGRRLRGPGDAAGRFLVAQLEIVRAQRCPRSERRGGATSPGSSRRSPRGSIPSASTTVAGP